MLVFNPTQLLLNVDSCVLLLQQLCVVPETANSDEMQEFLALNTDARIAFVKKPFIVSRIDKVLLRMPIVCFD